jgi:hypothetical protein
VEIGDNNRPNQKEADEDAEQDPAASAPKSFPAAFLFYRMHFLRDIGLVRSLGFQARAVHGKVMKERMGRARSIIR